MMRMTQMFSRIIVICVNGHDRGMATEYGAQIDQVETCLGGAAVLIGFAGTWISITSFADRGFPGWNQPPPPNRSF